MHDALQPKKVSHAPLITARDAEAPETIQALAEALRDYAGYFDQAITSLSADHVPADIWSDAEDWEWTIRAKALLHTGLHNRRVAAVVRVALDIHETVALWAWLGGDSWRTLRYIREHGVAVQHSRQKRPMFIIGGKRAAPPSAPTGQHVSAPDAPQGATYP